MSVRHPALDVFAARLGRIDILPGGFARLVFFSLDGAPIDPSIVLQTEAVTSAVMEITRAVAIGLIGEPEGLVN